jgi:hypothetical protein
MAKPLERRLGRCITFASSSRPTACSRSTGGYEAGVLDDTVSYIERLLRCRVDPRLRDLSLREFAADPIEHGTRNYF